METLKTLYNECLKYVVIYSLLRMATGIESGVALSQRSYDPNDGPTDIIRPFKTAIIPVITYTSGPNPPRLVFRLRLRFRVYIMVNFYYYSEYRSRSPGSVAAILRCSFCIACRSASVFPSLYGPVNWLNPPVNPRVNARSTPPIMYTSGPNPPRLVLRIRRLRRVFINRNVY